ncbi:MAG: RimK/LysX family protein [Pseudomonadota bacterium]
MREPPDLLTFGWREWVGLPQLGIPQIKAKVDTGARTSAVHAFEVEPFTEDGRDRVRFLVHPVQKDSATVASCAADILDVRQVTDSGGHREERYVIATMLSVGAFEWHIEATLTSRDDMLFRMLLGRTALQGRARVDPARSYLVGKKRRAVSA